MTDSSPAGSDSHARTRADHVLFARARSPSADEDPAYQQMQITVTTNSGFGASEPVTALVYAWGGSPAELDVQRPWSYPEFRVHHMASFVESVVKKCRASFEKQEGKLEVVMTARAQRSHRGAIPADHPARQ